VTEYAGGPGGMAMGALAARLQRRATRERRWSTISLWVGCVIVATVALLALGAPFLGLGNPNTPHLLDVFQSPSVHHLFGTDQLGRDVLLRVLYAGRVDLMVGLITTYVPLVLGVALGAAAGYLGGWFDGVTMRIVDVVTAFPFMVLVLAVIAVFGPGLKGVYVGLIVVGWSLYARVTRAEMLVLREREFMLAAETLGFSRWRIVVRHGIPNVIRASLVFSMLDIVLNILLLASLSYLGLGVQPPTAEWGEMIAEGQTYLFTAWWIATLPGLVVVLVGVGFSSIGDGLADRLGEDMRIPV
jgi:peptide/nickel transport system permease protein